MSRKFKHHLKAKYLKKGGYSAILREADKSETVLHNLDEHDVVMEDERPPKKKKMELKLKGLDEVGRKQLKRRTDEVFRSVEELAKKENVSVARILVFLLTRVVNRPLPGPWISITPAVHKLLAHSWELMQYNDNRGLGSLDESGLEGCNKILRSIRINMSRKVSQILNLVDTINRMWVSSDPWVNNEGGRLFHYARIVMNVVTVSDTARKRTLLILLEQRKKC